MASVESCRGLPAIECLDLSSSPCDMIDSSSTFCSPFCSYNFCSARWRYIDSTQAAFRKKLLVWRYRALLTASHFFSHPHNDSIGIYVRFMLVFTIHADRYLRRMMPVFTIHAGIYDSHWYLRFMLVFTVHAGIYGSCWYLYFVLIFTIPA